ncbi:MULTISPECIES: DUF3021 domain-containing protein [Streptococcus]|uniref:DUF3021 domain-containing protein n=1 Tax=Streptococcus TaxID=1301 RepID=UPI00066D133F|nr:DUF3021 domain-containing protein [Streptococcus anginosus]MCW1058958.1 DUF3021 domain-containing protein [Streptococcus anginosus]MDU3554481.1 DUF3021 domain-containing protein [Streptococcus anginosus]MDX5003293.1 DUF3021 domain-containing protein [Streptococcus anginosus]MDX5024993.1 DUF3021 domain-containing protein [Streptococcus anginosus]MDX5033017.1 DUF3021 domain-containing protein [Streptococcus anginosus]
MKKIVVSMLAGLRTGSLAYLLVLAIQIQESQATTANIISILIMSALIGLFSLLFEIERFSYLLQLTIHFFLTLIVVCVMMIYNGWAFNLVRAEFWLDFIVIYILIGLFVRLDIYLKTKKINESLVKLRRNRTKE